MNFTAKDWIGLAVSSILAFAVFGNISRKAGYPRWHGLVMAIPLVNIVALPFFAYFTWPIESNLLRLELGCSDRSILTKSDWVRAARRTALPSIGSPSNHQLWARL